MNYVDKFKQELPSLYGSSAINDSQVESEFYHSWDILFERIRHIQKEEVTFLEIGADRGLWSIMFFLVCKELGKTPVYVTATLIDDQNESYKKMGYDKIYNFLDYNFRNLNLYKLQEHYNSQGLEYHVINGNSQEEETLRKVTDIRKEYDLIFIDGDHTYDGVKKDISLYEPLCKSTLIFHDVVPKERKDFYVQVYPAIVDSGLTLDREIIYDGNAMGIGLKFY